MMRSRARRDEVLHLACLLAVSGVMLAGFVTGRSVCLWRALFGVPCPGCGMTRALLSLACADLHAAWAFNRNSFAVAPILLGVGARQAWAFRGSPQLRRHLWFIGPLVVCAMVGYAIVAWMRWSHMRVTASF